MPATAEASAPSTPRRPCDIAEDMIRHGAKKCYGAVPYLDALSVIENARQPYGLDSGESLALYALSNLAHWRTSPPEIARNLKAELRAVYGIKAR